MLPPPQRTSAKVARESGSLAQRPKIDNNWDVLADVRRVSGDVRTEAGDLRKKGSAGSAPCRSTLSRPRRVSSGVEQLSCKQQVVSSNLTLGSTFRVFEQGAFRSGEVGRVADTSRPITDVSRFGVHPMPNHESGQRRFHPLTVPVSASVPLVIIVFSSTEKRQLSRRREHGSF